MKWIRKKVALIVSYIMLQRIGIKKETAKKIAEIFSNETE